MNRSFITGVDHNHEWMLKWWFNNIRKHSSLPITICDFGMKDPAIKEWAREATNYFVEYEPHPKCAWFYKTQCLLDSAFDQTCWLDSDCEVLTNIDDIFDYIEEGKVGITKDVCRGRQPNVEEWWATGVIAVQGRPDILVEWNKVAHEGALRGDQEAFRHLLENSEFSEDYIVEIPNEYQWLRLQLGRKIDSPNKKVIHWTGPRGKQHIRTLV